MAPTPLIATSSDAASSLALAGRATAVPKPSLAGAVREFEGYFAGEMLRIAGRASAGAGALDGGAGGRLYREMFFEEIGRLVARSGGLGLARSLGVGAGDATGVDAAGRAER